MKKKLVKMQLCSLQISCKMFCQLKILGGFKAVSQARKGHAGILLVWENLVDFLVETLISFLFFAILIARWQFVTKIRD